MSNLVGTLEYGERGQVQVVEDGAALAREAAEVFVTGVNEAIARSGYAAVALSGGSTPKQMGCLLSEQENRIRVHWDKLHVFWGDERWVQLDSPESNAGEAQRGFLDAVGIPIENVHPFETVGTTPEESARTYESLVRAIVGSNGGIPVFDLIFLGMGDDGHTASLFPGTAAIHERERLVLSHFVPKLEATRLTFTPRLLNAGSTVVFLAAGAGKAERLHEVLDGPIDVDALPSQVVRPKSGPLWLVDRAAAVSLAKQPV